MFPTYNFDLLRVAGWSSLFQQLTSQSDSVAQFKPSILFLRQCVLLLCIYSVARVLFLSLFSRKQNSVSKARMVLRALLTVLTPTQSIWPSGYASLAYRAAKKARNDRPLVSLSLAAFYCDVLCGAVELRNPKSHLPLLLRDALSTVLGVSIRIEVNLYWWLKVLRWVVYCELLTVKESAPVVAPVARPKAYPPLVSSTGTDTKDHVASSSHATSAPGAIGFSPPSSRFLRSLHDEIPAIALDCVPRRDLQFRIRKLQASMLPGTFLMLGLTARAGTATQSFWSASTVLTALPFLPRTSRSERPRVQAQEEAGRAGEPPARRTTTPLFILVPTVVQLLTSGLVPLTVEVVRNVSCEYAGFLHRCTEELEDHPNVRAAFVEEWGIRAWIEERLCTAWEAALVDAGMLESWAIIVRKPE